MIGRGKRDRLGSRFIANLKPGKIENFLHLGLRLFGCRLCGLGCRLCSFGRGLCLPGRRACFIGCLCCLRGRLLRSLCSRTRGCVLDVNVLVI